MHRFFCPDLSAPPAQLPGPPGAPGPAAARSTVHLDRDEAHHARRVLRLQPGATVLLFDGQGRSARGRLTAWGQGATVELDKIHLTPPPRPAIDMAVAIPKGGHADDMVAALSQLGVTTLIPLRTERSIVDPRPAKIDRFNRAAIESAKQCGRAYLMKVTPPATLADVLAHDHDLRLFAAPLPPDATAPSMAARLRAAQRVLILVGPEGGWSPEEHRAAAAAGCLPWRLAPNILRIETAATAAAAIAGYLADFNRRDAESAEK